MFSGLESPTHLLIVLVIILLLFGAKRIPELANGLDPGRWTHQSFGCESRRRESQRCREQPHAIHQSSEQRPFGWSALPQTNQPPRLPGNLASRTTLLGTG